MALGKNSIKSCPGIGENIAGHIAVQAGQCPAIAPALPRNAFSVDSMVSVRYFGALTWCRAGIKGQGERNPADRRGAGAAGGYRG